MDQLRFEKVDSVLEAALNLEPESRAAFLERACDDDEDLRCEVELLLSKEAEAEKLEVAAIAYLAKDFTKESGSAFVGQRLSHYLIEERLGAGGMGEVYKAWDENLRRTVALKLLPAEFTADPDRVRRFEQEAFTASRLNHPNIVTIYEVIHADGAHFIAEEYVEGQTLRQMLIDPQAGQPRHLSVEKSLEIAIQIASALKAAHTAWIIHRDIKPENIMVREDGLVKVLDFGIAKLNEEEFGVPPSGGSIRQRSIPPEGGTPNLTVPGTIMGTASYMSPEQARGEQLDGRTDVFSLGLVLYEMVAGKQLLSNVMPAVATRDLHNAAEFLTSQTKLDGAPKEVEQAICKSLRVRREDRYASASELLDELKRLRQRLETRTSRRMVRFGLVALVAAILLAALAAWASINEVWEEKILRDGHTASVRRAIFSPDGRLLVSGGEDHQVIVWDFARRERLKTFTDHKGWVTALAFSPDGKWFATAGADGAVIVWDAGQLQKAATLPGHLGVVRSIAFSADGQFLVTPADGFKKNVWAVGSWEKVRIINTYGFQQAFFLLSPDGRGLITSAWGVYEVETGQPLTAVSRQHWAMAILSPDASRLISVGSGGAVIFWDVNRLWTDLQPRILSHQRPHQDHGRAVAYSPDARLAATGAEDILLWDANRMAKIARLKYPANVMGLEFSPDSRHLVSTHSDGAILRWDVAEHELQASFKEHSDSVRAVAFSPDGKRVASAGEDRSVIIWNQAGERKEMVLEAHQRRVTAVAFSSDGSNVASCDMDGNVIVWDLAERRPRLSFPSPRTAEDRASYCLALSPDGRWLATSFGVYDLAEQRMIFDYPTHEDGTYRQVYSVDFSSDGKRMVCVTAQGEALLWDVTEWRLIAEHQLQKANLVSVRFSPDGRWLATGEDQGALRLWETAPLREKAVIARHPTRIKSVAFSPDGATVVSAGDDKTISLWDVSRRKLITQIGVHASPVYSVAFSPDGKHLVSGGHDRTVRLYTRQRTLWGRRLN